MPLRNTRRGIPTAGTISRATDMAAVFFWLVLIAQGPSFSALWWPRSTHPMPAAC